MVKDHLLLKSFSFLILVENQIYIKNYGHQLSKTDLIIEK